MFKNLDFSDYLKLGGLLVSGGLLWGQLTSRVDALEVTTKDLPHALGQIFTKLDSIEENIKELKRELREMRKNRP